MGVLDSSFLFLPFGNDLLVVTLVARHHQGWSGYVIAAALGSTLGVSVLALVARKLGEDGVKKMAGEKKFARLHKMIEKHGSKAVFVACIAPPPFPFTMVIAAAAALNLSRLRICTVSFFARGLRFAVLALLAVKYGRHILEVANSSGFRWTMVGFIVLCLAGSTLSIRTWIRSVHAGSKANGRSPA
jgi:membrane protein YqaA with SNARE-associated domain